ncbi:hypothetical protein ABT237_04455 [Streptomyces sp. NPDC001581]|uniref:hypothetical protein n=1 Tax=Streptomyces sp. NPDC001581 TaxID=3154386 RepID=UPI00331D03DC
MTALIRTIIALPQDGLTAASTLTSLGIAVAALTSFVVHEVRTDSPMVPLALFRDRMFSGAGFSLVLLTFANGGLMLVLTQYLQFVGGHTPTETGLAFTPLAVAALLFNGLGATLGKKIGNRVMTAVGLAVIAAGFGVRHRGPDGRRPRGARRRRLRPQRHRPAGRSRPGCGRTGRPCSPPPTPPGCPARPRTPPATPSPRR